MMNCAEALSLVDFWEAEGKFPESRLVDFRDHITSCGPCANRFGGMLQLIERDAGAVNALATSPSDKIADSLSSSVLRKLASTPRNRVWIPAVAAAAAAAIFVLGIGLGVLVGRGGQSDSISVSFVLDAPEAREVSLVGDFNQWSSGTNAMYRASPEKPWEIKVILPKGRMYVYNFVIDGKLWVDDPTASEKIDDGFGGKSSLLRL